MILLVHVELDNPQSVEVAIRKLFQVVFLGPQRSGGTRQVDVYTALLVSSETTNSRYLRLKVKVALDEEAPVQIRDVGAEFFSNAGILRQFWGKDTIALNGAAELSQYAPIPRSRAGLIAEVTPFWPAPGAPARPLLVLEEERDRVPVLVFAAESMPESDSVVVDLSKAPSLRGLDDPDLRIASGIWFHSKFIAKIETHHDLIECEHHLRFEPSIRTDELRLYYSCPPHCDVLDQSGHIFAVASPSMQQPTDEFEIELYKVYSQSKTTYFQAWRHLGIRRGTLLRVQSSTSVINALASKLLHSVIIQFRATDVDAFRRRELRTLVTSIFLATVTAVGVDWTRLDSVRSLFLFPKAVTPLLWWLLMCASMVPLVFGGPSIRDTSTLRTGIRRFGRSMFLIWFVWAYLLTPSVQAWWHLAEWSRFVPITVIASGIVMSIFYLIDYFRGRAI